VSIAYEARFLHIGLNPLDEGWPLYAATRLWQGGVLYDDVLWVFPPGHLLPAWIGVALAPPGIVSTRVIYAAFAVALCVGLYFLARRLMPPPFALLAGLLVALAAPRSHHYQLVFGYRYLVFSVLALLAFDAALRTGKRRSLFWAGLAVGVGLVFRWDPAFAVACGLGVGVLCAQRPDPRRWLRETSVLGAGFAVVVAPTLLGFAFGVGLDVVWREVVLHPLVMLQPLPVPELFWPDEWDRKEIARAFVAAQFRLYPLLFAGYAVALVALRVRDQAAGRPFQHALLAATVVWGAVFFVRAFGRSDEPHIDSVIPPVCLLLAHLTWLGFDAASRRAGRTVRAGTRAAYGVGAVVLATWMFLLATDLAIVVPPDHGPRALMRSLAAKIERWTQPGDVILDVGHAPVLYVLAGRPGPGYRDVVMPGTFYDAQDERAFLARLEAQPPKLVIWPLSVFDEMPSRRIDAFAPQLVAWLGERYEPGALQGNRVFLFPRGTLPEDKPRPQIRCRDGDCGDQFQLP
jgi:hypothetical protein